MGWQFPQKILSCLNPQYTWNYNSQAGLASAGGAPSWRNEKRWNRWVMKIRKLYQWVNYNQLNAILLDWISSSVPSPSIGLSCSVMFCKPCWNFAAILAERTALGFWVLKRLWEVVFAQWIPLRTTHSRLEGVLPTVVEVPRQRHQWCFTPSLRQESSCSSNYFVTQQPVPNYRYRQSSE